MKVAAFAVITAAVKVKTLTGDDVERAYKAALKSLPRALDPGCDGLYVLGPAIPLGEPVWQHVDQSCAELEDQGGIDSSNRAVNVHICGVVV